MTWAGVSFGAMRSIAVFRSTVADRSVHVIVAVDQDGLAEANSLLDAADRGGHAKHQHGGMQMVERRDERRCRQPAGQRCDAKQAGGRWVRDSRDAGSGSLRRCRQCGRTDQVGRSPFEAVAMLDRYSSLSWSSTITLLRSVTVSISCWKRSYHSVDTSTTNITPWWAKPSWR